MRPTSGGRTPGCARRAVTLQRRLHHQTGAASRAAGRAIRCHLVRGAAAIRVAVLADSPRFLALSLRPIAGTESPRFRNIPFTAERYARNPDNSRVSGDLAPDAIGAGQRPAPTAGLSTA